ncbi:hypothetical protein SVAN01_05944 [Stagonosporopsis vannaccii]|nr:hypothetical protein SVAN01_05944 [Stagonosporopsis vannaccii]
MKRPSLRTMLLFTTIVLLAFYLLSRTCLLPRLSGCTHLRPTHLQRASRIVKATLAPHSLPLPHQQSLALHERQNERFGYAMHVLRVPIVRGAASVLYFLMDVVIREMEVTHSDGGWVLYFDPGVVPLFPEQGLGFLLPPPPTDADADAVETLKSLSLILPSAHHRTKMPTPFPPSFGLGSDTAAVALDPDLDLDFSIFWLRISATTLEILAAAVVHIHSSREESMDVDTDTDVAASSLRHILEARKAWEKGEVLRQPGERYGVDPLPLCFGPSSSPPQSAVDSVESGAEVGNGALTGDDIENRVQAETIQRQPVKHEPEPEPQDKQGTLALFAHPPNMNVNAFASLRVMEALLLRAEKAGTDHDAETIDSVETEAKEWWERVVQERVAAL